MYDFNLVVSCAWGSHRPAKEEIRRVLKDLGDTGPWVSGTIAKGIIGVKTSLNSREVVRRVRDMFEKDASSLQYTLKWVPVDAWIFSDIESIKRGVGEVRNMISKGETWRMTVNKRRYVGHHTIDIIREAAELIDEKVNLKNPDKILRIELIGKYAGISVLKPEEIFSTAR